MRDVVRRSPRRDVGVVLRTLRQFPCKTSGVASDLCRNAVLAEQTRPIVAAELDLTGITLDWGTLTWLVPAGARAYDGMTPIAAVFKAATADYALLPSFLPSFLPSAGAGEG